MIESRVCLLWNNLITQADKKNFYDQNQLDEWFMDTSLALYDQTFWQMEATHFHKKKHYEKQFIFTLLEPPNREVLDGECVPLIYRGCKNDEEAFKSLRRDVHTGVLTFRLT